MNDDSAFQSKLNSNIAKKVLTNIKRPQNCNYKCSLKNRYSNFNVNFNKKENLPKYNNFEPDLINLQIKFIPKNKEKVQPKALDSLEILNQINKLKFKNWRMKPNASFEKLKVFTNNSIKTSYSISYRIMNKLNKLLKKDTKKRTFLMKRNPFGQKAKSIDMSKEKKLKKFCLKNNESDYSTHSKTKSAFDRYINQANSKLVDFTKTFFQKKNLKSQNKKIIISSRQNRRSYIKEIPPIITTYGCFFTNKSQEYRFFKLIKYLRTIQKQLKENPEEKTKIIQSLIFLISNCCANKWNEQDIDELIQDIIKMNNSSQIQQNKIIKDCKLI